MSDNAIAEDGKQFLLAAKFAGDLDVQVSKVWVKEIHDAIGLYAFDRMSPEDLISIVLRKARELKTHVHWAKEHNPVFREWLASMDAQITLGVIEAFVRSEVKSKDQVAHETGFEN